MSAHTVAARPVTNWPLAAVLLLGPVVSVVLLAAAMAHGSLATLTPQMYLGAAVLFWSPLPFSIPAVLLEAHRDAALPRLRGLLGWALRAVLLLPYLVTSPRSAVRVEAAASLAGFAAALVLAWPQLGISVPGVMAGATHLLTLLA